MHLLSLVLLPFLFVFLHLSPAFAQSNTAIVPSSTSTELNKYPTLIPIPSNAASTINFWPTGNGNNLQSIDELPEGPLEPLREASVGPGEVSSGPSDTMPQIAISTQDQKSATSNTIVTASQFSGNPIIDYTVTQSTSSSGIPLTTVPNLSGNPMTQPLNFISQQTSSSSISVVAATQNPSRALAQSTSTLATAVTQLSNNLISHSPSSINHQSSSSFNNDYPPTQLLHLPLNAVTHNISSMDYQTSSSSSSNSNPSHILPSDSSLIDHPPGQIFPATTPTVVPGPSATQAIIPEATASSAVGLANTTLAGTGILPLEESATPDKVANAAIESVGNGVEIVQTLPTTAFIDFTIPLVAAAADSSVELIVPISASMGIVPPGTSAASVTPAKSTIQSGGNGSSAVTGSGSTTGSGNPTESVSGHTTVPIVSTGGAEGVTRCDSWWLEFGILICGVGMVYWM